MGFNYDFYYALPLRTRSIITSKISLIIKVTFNSPFIFNLFEIGRIYKRVQSLWGSNQTIISVSPLSKIKLISMSIKISFISHLHYAHKLNALLYACNQAMISARQYICKDQNMLMYIQTYSVDIVPSKPRNKILRWVLGTWHQYDWLHILIAHTTQTLFRRHIYL